MIQEWTAGVVLDWGTLADAQATWQTTATTMLFEERWVKPPIPLLLTTAPTATTLAPATSLLPTTTTTATTTTLTATVTLAATSTLTTTPTLAATPTLTMSPQPQHAHPHYASPDSRQYELPFSSVSPLHVDEHTPS